MDGPLGYHMHLYRNSHAAAAAASGRGIPSVTSSPASNSNYGKALPPAPTSYRGSITTGQSAQQIQLQQAAALHTTLQQFQAAAAVQQQQQQQQQHIPKVEFRTIFPRFRKFMLYCAICNVYTNYSKHKYI